MGFWTSARRKLTRWTRYSASERLLFVQALMQLSLVAVLRRVMSFRRLRDLFTRRPAAAPIPSGSTDMLERAERFALIVEVASAYAIPRPNCLDRSLVLWSILSRHQIESHLRFGVWRDGEVLDAHAWVEYRGIVLNDTEDVGTRYTPIDPEASAVTPASP